MNDSLDAGTTVASVAGVTLGAVEAGVRYPDRRDLVAFQFAEGTTAAALFTKNAFCAAPVQVARESLQACANRPRALLINTGNANAGTGEAGLAAAHECCQRLAEVAGLEAQQVLPFSTGVIGEDLPVTPIVEALPALLAACSEDGWESAAWGILTTDTRPKLASRQVSVDGASYVLTGMAKGAGMLRPNMATMLAFLATDAPIHADLLNTLLQNAVEKSFHRITVDGDTSTNDAVLLAATGVAGGEELSHGNSPGAKAFGEALDSLCLELAQGLVRDGEGATRFVEVAVSGGASSSECLAVAFTVAHSPLVKTALFAGDPNWGRILAAIGRADVADLDVNGVRILVNDLPIADRGGRAADYDESAVEAAMEGRELVLSIDLGRGGHRESVWTSDFPTITCASMPSTEAEAGPFVHVAVAVIVNEYGKVLLTRRHPDSHQGDLWEFPGGKLEADEDLSTGLRRELQEELGIDVRRHQPLLVIEHDYGDKRVCLDVHRVDEFSGEPEPREGQPMRWVPLSELNDYEFPAANKLIVERLQQA